MFESCKLEESCELNEGEAKNLESRPGITIRDDERVNFKLHVYNGENKPFIDAIGKIDTIPILTFIDLSLYRGQTRMKFNILEIMEENQKYYCLHALPENENRGEMA